MRESVAKKNVTVKIIENSWYQTQTDYRKVMFITFVLQ